MKELIENHLDHYIKENNVTLTKEEYEQAYQGVAFWLSCTLPEATEDSIMSVLGPTYMYTSHSAIGKEEK